MDEGRKRVLLIAASILAARKLSTESVDKRSPRAVYAISEAIVWARRILEEIDRMFPVRK